MSTSHTDFELILKFQHILYFKLTQEMHIEETEQHNR